MAHIECYRIQIEDKRRLIACVQKNIRDSLLRGFEESSNAVSIKRQRVDQLEREINSIQFLINQTKVKKVKQINDLAAAAMITAGILKVNVKFLNTTNHESGIYAFMALESDELSIGDRILVPSSKEHDDGVVRASNAVVVDIQDKSKFDVYSEKQYKFIIQKLDTEGYSAKALAMSKIASKVEEKRREREQQSVLSLLGFSEGTSLELELLPVEVKS